MKRILVAVFSIMMLLVFTNNTQVMAETNSKISVTVDSKHLAVNKVTVNLEGKELKSNIAYGNVGINYEGNALIPVRALGEALGAEVTWDDVNKTAIIKTSDKTIELKKDSSTALVNGKKVDIDNNAKIKLVSMNSGKNSFTMAPVRFISQTLGATVGWVDSTNTANITSVKQEEVQKPVKPQEDNKPEAKPEVKPNKIKSVIAKDVDGSKIPEIHIEAEKEIKYIPVQSNSKTIIIDILDATIDEKNITENCNAIEKITAKAIKNNKNENTVRITIELNEKLEDLGHTIPNNEKNKNNLIIKIENNLAGIEKQIINGKEAIVIKNVYSSKTNLFSLSNPNRLVVDVRNTNLNNIGIGSQVSTDIVKELRLGQYTGHEYDPTEKVARVVLDISENYENPSFTTEERGNDLIIFVEGTKKATPVVPTPPTIEPPPSDNNTNTNKQKVIVIDAGHGGGDGGASYGGVKEKDLALKVSLKTRDKLESLGYKVLMTRTTDVYPSLNDRPKLANDNNADAFLSIHFNAATSTATGIETLYNTKNSGNKAFAQSIQNELIKDTGARDRGLKLREGKNGLAVLNGTKGISALAELGFISNPKDLKEINTDSYQEKVANSLANGIHKYLSK